MTKIASECTTCATIVIICSLFTYLFHSVCGDNRNENFADGNLQKFYSVTRLTGIECRHNLKEGLSVWSLHNIPVPAWFMCSRFPLKSKHMHVGFDADSNLAIVSVNLMLTSPGCFSPLAQCQLR